MAFNGRDAFERLGNYARPDDLSIGFGYGIIRCRQGIVQIRGEPGNGHSLGIAVWLHTGSAGQSTVAREQQYKYLSSRDEANQGRTRTCAVLLPDFPTYEPKDGEGPIERCLTDLTDIANARSVHAFSNPAPCFLTIMSVEYTPKCTASTPQRTALYMLY